VNKNEEMPAAGNDRRHAAINQPEQEQEHAMPHQSSVAGFHGILLKY
jgi:hypothetical protein